jgi:hypothetical protein
MNPMMQIPSREIQSGGQGGSVSENSGVDVPGQMIHQNLQVQPVQAAKKKKKV